MNYNKVLIFGDSIAYGEQDHTGGWVARLKQQINEKYNQAKVAEVYVYNLGVPSELMALLPHRVMLEIESRLDLRTDKPLFIYAAGINDANLQNSMSLVQTNPAQFKSSINELINIARNSKADMGFIGLTPISEKTLTESYPDITKFTNKAIAQYEQLIEEVCMFENVPMLKLHKKLNNEEFKATLKDGMHPDEAGHKQIFELIQDFLKQNFAI